MYIYNKDKLTVKVHRDNGGGYIECSECGEIMANITMDDATIVARHVEAMHSETPVVVEVADTVVEAPAPTEKAEEVHHCMYILDEGRFCSRKPTGDSAYCYQHKPEFGTVALDLVMNLIETVTSDEAITDDQFAEAEALRQQIVMEYCTKIVLLKQIIEGKIETLETSALSNLYPTPRVLARQAMRRKEIEELTLQLDDLQQHPLWVEGGQFALEELQAQKLRKIQNQIDKELAEKKASVLKNLNDEFNTQAEKLNNLLFGKTWVPSRMYGAEPMIQSIWFRLNTLCNIAGIDSRERRNFTKFITHIDDVIDEIVGQFVIIWGGKPVELIKFTNAEGKKDAFRVKSDISFDKAYVRQALIDVLKEIHGDFYAGKSYKGKFEMVAKPFLGDNHLGTSEIVGDGKSFMNTEKRITNDSQSYGGNALSDEDIAKLRRFKAQEDDAKAFESVA